MGFPKYRTPKQPNTTKLITVVHFEEVDSPPLTDPLWAPCDPRMGYPKYRTAKQAYLFTVVHFEEVDSPPHMDDLSFGETKENLQKTNCFHKN